MYRLEESILVPLADTTAAGYPSPFQLILFQHIADKPNTQDMPSVHPSTLRQIVPFLFLPAGIGLLFEIAIAPSVALKVLAFALALFCPELARMAWIDLKNIELVTLAEAPATAVEKVPFAAAAVTTQLEKTALLAEQSLRSQGLLNRFYAVVVSTIALEATGFYLTFASLPVGAIVIVLIQFWFNLLANIQLYPDRSVSVVSFGIRDRRAVLVVNAITAGLLCLWPLQPLRLGLAIALSALTTLFLTIKYGFLKPELLKSE